MKLKIDLKIFIFIILFYLTKQIEIYATIMIFCMLHEIGHLLAGLILGMIPESIKIMPFGFSITFKTDINGYNKKIGKANVFAIKKLFIALAGPLTNIILIILFLFINIDSKIKQVLIYSNILIVLFNLITIYPLDGGRILKEILHICFGIKKAKIYTNEISIITVIFLTLLSSIAIYYFKNIAILFMIIFLWGVVIRENRKFELNMRLYDKIERYN